MKVKILSDTHGFHKEEPIDEVDLLIHCGDASNNRYPYLNENEFLQFWMWWEEYPAKYKIFVPGNHDSFLESPISKTLRRTLKPNNWILMDRTITIEKLKIFGSPFTPDFNNWSFMVNRSKIHKHWKLIEKNTDIIVTHGPPKYHLDLTIDRGHKLFACGDSSLLKAVNKIKPKYHFFGHVHCLSEDTEILTNKGWRDLNTINYNDKVINLNISTLQLEEDTIQEIITSPFRGDLINIKGMGIDTLTTENHKFIDFRKRKTEKIETFLAKDVGDRCHRDLPCSGTLFKEDMDISDNEISLSVQVAADGKWGSDIFTFCLKKRKKINRLCGLLDDMGITYSTNKQRRGDLKITFKYSFKYFPKPLPSEFINLSNRQVEIMLDEYFITNGSCNIGVSKIEEANLLQALLITNNYTCYLVCCRDETGYVLYSNKKKSTVSFCRNTTKVTKIPYKGLIWCLNTKNGTIITRRNGKVIITKNSNKEFENNGTLERNSTKFVNCSQVKDGMFSHGLMYKGKIIEI